MTEDRIERELTIAAPRAQVWSTLTDPEHVTAWFSETPAQIDLREGGIMRLDHGEGGGIYPMRIVKVNEPSYFAYRWASAYPGEVADDHNSTLVEFTLEAAGEGTKLHMVESGFADQPLPEGQDGSALYEGHSQGWTMKLGQARDHAEQIAG